jgi:hypothetical protein
MADNSNRVYPPSLAVPDRFIGVSAGKRMVPDHRLDTSLTKLGGKLIHTQWKDVQEAPQQVNPLVRTQRTGVDWGGKGNARLTKNERREQNRANLKTAHHNPATTETYSDIFVIAVLSPVNEFSRIQALWQ